jgi:hypothetical protein
MITRNSNLKEVRSSKKPKRNPVMRIKDFLMDNGVVTDNTSQHDFAVK